MDIKKKLIKRILDINFKSKEGHVPSSLSILDILYVLYKNIINDDNIFILSKGHASIGLYVILEYFNLLEENLDNFCNFNSKLGGHPTNRIKNVNASTGSLGHGLGIGIGIAMVNKIKNNLKHKTYILIGDGESNEGTIWECALLSSQHKLSNLYCILDYNKSNNKSINLDSLLDKFKSFGWYCIEIDGHDHNQILRALLVESEDKPVFILANTIKGKGINIMENNQEWHHKTPNEIEYKELLNELK
jgi:transketolase